MRSWKQRLCSLLLCGAMLASLCPTALAEGGGIYYLDENGDKRLCETYTTVATTGIGWNTTNNPSGWYVVENSVEITYSVTVTGEVHLILMDNCELNAKRGIEVSKRNSLTIYAQSKDESAMGKLTAIGDGGNITISGGTVEALSAGGADIGGGFDYNTGSIAPSNKIEISDGANVKGSGGGKPNLGPHMEQRQTNGSTTAPVTGIPAK